MTFVNKKEYDQSERPGDYSILNYITSEYKLLQNSESFKFVEEGTQPPYRA